MPRMESSQQIDLQQGTIHSLEASWPERSKKSLVGGQSEIFMISRTSCSWKWKTQICGSDGVPQVAQNGPFCLNVDININIEKSSMFHVK